jgi:hypothetical protein
MFNRIENVNRFLKKGAKNRQCTTFAHQPGTPPAMTVQNRQKKTALPKQDGSSL